ncbi:MAG TPA: M1 family metallopeptidase [Chitinophagaceae bacterium]|nr:M1 family metallopeptidase [Chitinophagaceae bacterium]
MRKLLLLLLTSYFLHLTSTAQPDRWQQRIKYVMDINVDAKTDIIRGKQAITYINNSPDTLKRIFIHLFWNAFKPNSMMDVNSRSTENLILGTDKDGKPVKDFDKRFKKRIVEMTPGEQGYCNVLKFISNGRQQKTKLHETILEVILDRPVLPRSSTVFNTEFECKIPILSRRSGRESPEGIRYSIGQWYPKVSEYDYEGWHADDYISREFYGVWGDFDVNITIDKNYKLGATGVLQNAAAIGWGYDKEGTTLKPIQGDVRTWKFSAKNVHDFVWAADPNYKHVTRQTANGPLLHFIYLPDSTETKWMATADSCAIIFPFMAKTFGAYPYPVYSFIQGGGGGTEYPMATLIKNFGFETAVHEWCHSWYQMMLGTNENLYAWMDEGFTDYAEAKVLAWLRKKDFFEGAEEYDRYFSLARSRFDEPMSTHANWYSTNLAYNTNAYFKGAVFLRQLGYVVSEQVMDKILLEYYRQWRFKHPNPNDFIRVAEKVSNMQLQWYKEYMLNTMKTVDYGIDSLWEEKGVSTIRLRRVGEMPMPIDLELTFKDGSEELHYVPLNLMFGEKPAENKTTRVVHEEWKWTHTTYTIEFKRRLTDLKEVKIDPTGRLADIDERNNFLRLNW